MAGEKKKAVPKKLIKRKKEKKKKKNAVINQKGKKNPPPYGVVFFPSNLDTTVALPKDVQRPVCTDEMLNFVITTLSIF